MGRHVPCQPKRSGTVGTAAPTTIPARIDTRTPRPPPRQAVLLRRPALPDRRPMRYACFCTSLAADSVLPGKHPRSEQSKSQIPANSLLTCSNVSFSYATSKRPVHHFVFTTPNGTSITAARRKPAPVPTHRPKFSDGRIYRSHHLFCHKAVACYVCSFPLTYRSKLPLKPIEAQLAGPTCKAAQPLLSVSDVSLRLFIQ